MTELVSGKWFLVNFKTVLGKTKEKKFIFLNETNEYKIFLAPIPVDETGKDWVYRRIALHRENITSIRPYIKQK